MNKTIIPCVYRIMNTSNGRSYYGQSKNVHKRWSEHKHCLIRGDHRNKPLQDDYNKGHQFIYEILQIEPDEQVRKEIEESFVRLGGSYNTGGKGGKRPYQACKNVSIAQANSINNSFKVKVSCIYCRKVNNLANHGRNHVNKCGPSH